MFTRRMIQLIEHQLEVGIQLQRGAAEYDQIRSIPVRPARIPARRLISASALVAPLGSLVK